MKRCLDCDEDKSDSEFYVHSQSGALHSYCKACCCLRAKTGPTPGPTNGGKLIKYLAWEEVPGAVEDWREVPSRPGVEVSSLGRVRTLHRVMVFGSGNVRIRRGVLRKQRRDKKGYLTVTLHAHGRGRVFRVHQLIAAGFLGPCPAGLEVCHKDGDQLNNRAINLRYGTRSSNAQDAIRHGTHHKAAQSCCKRSHALVAPNLVATPGRRSRRGCLACSRARAHCRRHPEHDLQVIGDQYFAEIMAAKSTSPKQLELA